MFFVNQGFLEVVVGVILDHFIFTIEHSSFKKQNKVEGK
jgi:hypothetical protein